MTGILSYLLPPPPESSDRPAVRVGDRAPGEFHVLDRLPGGGALALASPDRMWIYPDRYLSVIGPHAAAAILKRDRTEVPALAVQLRPRPQDLLKDGLVRGIAGSAVIATDRFP